MADAPALEGIDARTVRVAGDVVSAPTGRRSERRGGAGGTLVVMIAGAAADPGHDMAAAGRPARHADARTAAMGAAPGP